MNCWQNLNDMLTKCWWNNVDELLTKLMKCDWNVDEIMSMNGWKVDEMFMKCWQNLNDMLMNC